MTVVAQTTSKPKTLKELVAEEKARKEAEKKEEQEKKAREEQRAKAKEAKDKKTDATTPEEAADFVTETDSAIWAP